MGQNSTQQEPPPPGWDPLRLLPFSHRGICFTLKEPPSHLSSQWEKGRKVTSSQRPSCQKPATQCCPSTASVSSQWGLWAYNRGQLRSQRRVAYMAIVIQQVIGQLQLIERHNLLHPLCAFSR